MATAGLAHYRMNLALILVSAALWTVFWFLNAWLFARLNYGTGISLIYFPAGVRLGIVLIFGIWGAIGIALSNPVLFVSEFGARPLAELLLDSAIAGFVPLAVARASQWAMGVGPDLANLRPRHLPLLALAVSVCTPLAFNLLFVAEGLKPLAELWRNWSAMALGDFLGCLIALVLIRLLLPLFTHARRLQHGG